MDKKTLKSMADRYLSTREMAKESGKSPTSIRYWLSKHKLATRIRPFNKGGENKKPRKFRKPYLCAQCGENDPKRFYHARTRCKNCHNEGQKQRVKDLKKRAVEYKGGGCKHCGYKKNLAALDFHHLNPFLKDINWRSSRHWRWERIKKELDNCILVCRNCHAEIHYPDYGM